MTRSLTVSAPGKLMVAGEYAVLEGYPCLVAAVDRRARVTLATDGSPPGSAGSPEMAAIPREALLARTRAEARCGSAPAGTLYVDVSELRTDGRKLGLGSSAAAAAGAAAVVYAATDRDLSEDGVRREVLDAALEGHRAVAPEGSGADVAASTLGGLVRFQREDVAATRAIAWPEKLTARVVWTGVEARTSDLVARVREAAESDPGGYRAVLDPLASATEDVAGAFEAGDAEAVVAATRAHHEAMAGLGRFAAAPIVEERLRSIAEVAQSAGGAAKPSGAGGGDVALALFSDAEAANRFEVACSERGMTLLSLVLGTEGVRLETDLR